MKTPSKIKYDIFFCHPSKDRRKSSLIVNFLRVIIKEALNDKYRIFYSPEDLKQERASKAWRRGLNYALKVSKCMIAYYTPNAYASKWMKYEIGAMASRDKPLIPITTGAVDLSKLLINDGTAKNIASGGIAALEDWVKNVIDEVAHKSPQRISNSEETNSINQEIKNVSIWFQNQSNLDKIERFLKKSRLKISILSVANHALLMTNGITV